MIEAHDRSYLDLLAVRALLIWPLVVGPYCSSSSSDDDQR